MLSRAGHSELSNATALSPRASSCARPAGLCVLSDGSFPASREPLSQPDTRE